MSGTFNHKGLPSSLVLQDDEAHKSLVTEDGIHHVSVNKTFTGNLTNDEFVVPPLGCYLILKGISVIGDGSQGTVKVLRGSNGGTILPCYFSNSVRSSPSGAFNFKLDVNEKVLITATSRLSNETFVGISYIIVNPNL